MKYCCEELATISALNTEDLDRLERWTEKMCLKFNKGKCRKEEKPLELVQAGTDPLESSSAQKDLGVLEDNKLSKSHRVLCGQGQWCSGGIRKSIPIRSGR